MLLGSSAIAQALADGRIVCDPAPTRIESAHIDVTLGMHYWVFEARLTRYPLDLTTADPRAWYMPGYTTDGYVEIPAMGSILAHTAERIGTAPGSGLLPTLHTRSTLARWQLSVHQSAGFGDPGFINFWALEITNPHSVPVRLRVGSRVGCVTFQRIEGDYEPYPGGYSPDTDWVPSQLLPRKGNW